MDSRKLLGRKELLSLAIGQVIGAGVISVLGAAIAETGESVWLAYAVAVILGYILIFPYVILSSVLKLEGGFYSIVKKLAGNKSAGIFIALYVPQFINMALMGISMGMYVNSIFPGVDKMLVGIVSVTAFYLLNLLDITTMARVQKIMATLLIATLVIFALYGLGQVNTDIFEITSPDFFLKGKDGCISAVILLVYSTTGYYLTVNYGGVSINPRKDIPWAMNVTAMVLFLLYTITAITASGVLPVPEVANKPLTFVAEKIFNKQISVLFVIGGPIMALVSTINPFFANWSRLFLKASEDGWFPEIFTRVNKFGQPVYILTFIYIAGILPIILNFSVSLITRNVIFVVYIANLIPLFTILTLPAKYPNEWRNSKFHIPDKFFYALMALVLGLQFWVIYMSGTGLTRNVLIVSSSYAVFAVFYALNRSKRIESIKG